MDKFTSHSGGNGKSTKRTKIVVQNRTYMKGGYMTTAAEEVEVTDDEEVGHRARAHFVLREPCRALCSFASSHASARFVRALFLTTYKYWNATLLS